LSAARVDKKFAKLRDELPKFESFLEMQLTIENTLAEKVTQIYTDTRLEQCTLTQAHNPFIHHIFLPLF